MIFGPDKKKLSKRHGAVSVIEYQEQGFMPDAMMNYLARLGWAHGDQEIFTKNQLIECFDLAQVGVGHSGAAFSLAQGPSSLLPGFGQPRAKVSGLGHVRDGGPGVSGAHGAAFTFTEQSGACSCLS